MVTHLEQINFLPPEKDPLEYVTTRRVLPFIGHPRRNTLGFLAGSSCDISRKGSLLLAHPIHARTPKVFTPEEVAG
jgi:hypothetical protein